MAAVLLLLLWSLKPDCSGDQWAQITTHIFSRIFRFIAHASWQLSTQLTACSCKDSSGPSRIQAYERTPEAPRNVGTIKQNKTGFVKMNIM